MNECTVCNLCESPATFDQASEVHRVRSNVRRFQEENFTVWRCRNCQSLHSKESVDLDRYYRHYPIHSHQIDPVTRNAYRNRLRSITACGVSRGAKILDYGCGHGVFVKFLRESGYDAEGYDAYDPVYADTKALDLRYDVVTAYDVVEHAPEPRDLFRQLVRLLTSGGLLVIGTPAADQIDLSDVDAFLMELHQPYHRHIFSERALIDDGKAVGLRAVRVDRRSYYDTLFPFLNARYGGAYLRRAGNVMDAVFEKPQAGLMFASPRMLFYAFAGYLFPPSGNITVFFR
jgi:2-polyprenyl-3-methyl-5-hydroxy-6-metoxy-1,4-benzoquinol methylase